jgi:hypothetical protein
MSKNPDELTRFDGNNPGDGHQCGQILCPSLLQRQNLARARP